MGLLAFASSQTCAMVSRQMPFSLAFCAKTFIISYFLPKNALKIASKFQPFCYNCSKKNQRQKMKLISWNVNGARACASKGALEWIKQAKPDFIGFQEVKAKAEQLPKDFSQLGFNTLYVNSAKRAGYSGVATLSNFKSEIFNARFFDDDEGRVIEHVFGNTHLFNIYFPNGQSGDERLAFKMDFYAKFLAHIKALAKAGKSVIFCGDVNTAHREIDLARPKQNEDVSGFLPIERAWIDDVIAAGFVDTFRLVRGDEKDRYSWWSYRAGARERNVGWRIDYFFVSSDLVPKVKNADILADITGSDHCPVMLEIDL